MRSSYNYPYRDIQSVPDKQFCPYCYWVNRLLSRVVCETYSLNPNITEVDLKDENIRLGIEANIRDRLVQQGYPLASPVCYSLDLRRHKNGSMFLCPYCGIWSGWADTKECAENDFTWSANGAVDRWLADIRRGEDTY